MRSTSNAANGRNAKPAPPPLSSTVKASRAPKKGGLHRSDGFDAGKLIKGKKRHILVDTLGLLLHAIVHAADVQDRDGGILLLATLFGQFPFLRKLFADSAYRGPIFANALAEVLPYLKTEIVKRPDHAKRFVQLPKR
jgi:putative transposase